MQAYKAYYRRGHVVPVDEPIIPEGSELIITVLESRREQQGEFVEDDKLLRLEWLDRLHDALNLAESEPFPFTPRSSAMREPLALND